MLAVMILSVIAPPATYNCVRRCPVGPAGRPPHLLLWKVAPGTPSTLPAYAQVDLSAPLPDHAWSPANPPATCYQRSAKPNLCRSSPSLSRPGQRGDASLFPLYHSFICWAAGSLVCKIA